MGRVDDCVALAERPEVFFATFGDAMRVPGSRKSLMQAKAEGADVRIVYSPLDALALARRHPEREVVFFGLGFETTMPSTALTVLQAEAEGTPNFSVFCNHITIVPTLKALLESPDLALDGFIGPGHVSMVIGPTASSPRPTASPSSSPASSRSTSSRRCSWSCTRSGTAAPRSRTSTGAWSQRGATCGRSRR
jgi:hydrogenase expression/formation protein HypD